MELKQSHLLLLGRGRVLLIVPYGIETTEVKNIHHHIQAFNRTLWN